jgi:hypothetical protein
MRRLTMIPPSQAAMELMGPPSERFGVSPLVRGANEFLRAR